MHGQVLDTILRIRLRRCRRYQDDNPVQVHTSNQFGTRLGVRPQTQLLIMRAMGHRPYHCRATRARVREQTRDLPRAMPATICLCLYHLSLNHRRRPLLLT